MAHYSNDGEWVSDWEDLGDDIERIIDRAINSRNYQRLNQKITQAVNLAVDTGSEAVRKAVEESRRTAQRERAARNRRIVYDVTPPKPQTKRASSSLYQTRPQPANNLPVLYSSATGKTAIGIIETIGGSMLSGGTGIGLLVTALVKGLFIGGSLLTSATALMVAGFGGGLYLLGSGIGTLAKVSRFKEYVRTMGQKTHCDLDQLARSVGKPVKFVKKELQKMISEGLFLEGHLDAEQRNLITSNETFREFEQSRLQLEQRQKQEKQEAAERAQSEISAEVQEVLDRGNAFIKEIRRCNDAIPGEEISGKIFRMEMIIKKIFDRAKEHPEIVPDLKRLMDYYLPMTVKLLNAYADMDAQPVQGETIQNSKREIEATLDTLNTAFEKLLDSVFKETAMDVSSDISVLQTLLAQEGLTDDFAIKKKERQEN